MRETCRSIGIEFDGWQQDLNKCLLAKNAQGLYAADTVVLSIARQVGKTYDIGAVAFALCIAIPGLTVVWTAHRFKVARESFNEMRSWAKSPLLAPHIDYEDITTGAGNECIPFRNGSRIVFAARERGAIRGFTKVGMLVLDEAQILTEAALSDLVPTTNQAPNPLVVLMGTPPKPTDPGEVFTRLRQEALAGESSDVLYAELSADANADPDDREQWRKANPSYPERTPERAILRLRKLLSAEDFLREGLGIWSEGGANKPISPVQWASLALPRRRPRNVMPVFFPDVSPGMRSAAIGVAYTAKKRPHVELADHRPGAAWLVARCKALAKKYPGATWAVDGQGAIGALLPELADAGIEPVALGTADMGRACAHLQQLVDEAGLSHSGDDAVAAALAGAVKRDVGDGMWAWGRRKSSVDICPIVAVTGAAWQLVLEPDYDIAASVY